MRRLCVGWLLFACGVVSAAAEERPYTRNVAIVIYNGVEVLDFAGPAEVFEAASRFGANGADKAFNVYTVSKTKSPITSQGFLQVTPNYTIADSPKPDILVLPGGAAESVAGDSDWMAWIRGAAKGSEQILTVCTGAFIAGKAGLLDDIEATTWYRAIPYLAEQFPKAHVQPGRRFVDSGKVITTAGVSAGVDGSLHLVARTFGRYAADRTAEYMEYKWAPESYLSARYAQLNPRLDAHGQALQRASIATREGKPDSAIEIYRSLLAADHNDQAAWLELGRALHGAKRYSEAIAANLEAAKAGPQRGIAFYNLACEYALTGEREKAIEAATRAVEVGYRQKASYQGDRDLAAIRDDPRFQALINRM